jgi:hypothetical protein
MISRHATFYKLNGNSSLDNHVTNAGTPMASGFVVPGVRIAGLDIGSRKTERRICGVIQTVA